MLDVYKEALELQKSTKSFGASRATKSSAAKTIFDLDEEQVTDASEGKIGLESSVEKLKQAIKKVKEEKRSADDPQNEKLLKEIDELASKESKRTPVDVYNEVVFDEVNDELMKSVQKASGETIVMLIRQERLKSF